MDYIVGNAIKIFSELCEEDVTGSTVTCDAIYDPDGVQIATALAMTFVENIASCSFQTSVNATLGRYKYVCKVVNGIYTNYEEGSFFLRAR